MKIGMFQGRFEDLISQTLVEGLKELGHTVVSDRGLNGAPVGNLDDHSFDFYVEHSGIDVDTNSSFGISMKYKKLLAYVNGDDLFEEHPWTAYTDGSRYSEDYEIYFRREFFEKYKKENELPFQMGIMKHYLQHVQSEKTDSIIFPSNGEYPNRQSLIEYLKESVPYVKTGRIGTFVHVVNTHASREEYYKEIGKARAIIVSHGWGQDTARFWEAVATGAVVIAQRLRITMPHPFTHMENVLWWDHPSEAISLIERVKNGEFLEIGLAAREHGLKYHTTRARANSFLEALRRHEFLRLQHLGAPVIIPKA